MTCARPASQPENAVERHFDRTESFADYAHSELHAAPLHVPGVCYQPECSRHFTPNRPWQRYCSPDCERAGRREFSRWGLRMAEAMLAHRIGKYEASDTAIRERTRTARRYVTRLQSEWLADRQDRMERAKHGAA